MTKILIWIDEMIDNINDLLESEVEND